MDIKYIIDYIPLLLIPFLLSLIFTPIVRIVALRTGIISYPRTDRWHKNPTALLGGIGIFLSTAISAAVLNIAAKDTLGLFLGATLLVFVGLLDDKFHLKPYTKLFTQIIAGCIAVFFGIILKLPVANILVIPLTLLWIIGVTNSFNLLDNIDGLSAGIAAIASFMLFMSSLFYDNTFGRLALILCGATLGFLPYNFNPAKIFMGDSGSMFLGYCLALISIAGTTRHLSNLFITMLIPVFILSVPIFDTFFVMILRTIQGRKIFEGGKDHASHHLVALGLSQRKTVLLLYVISIVFGLLAISYSRLNVLVIAVIAFLAIVILSFFGLFLSETVSSSELYRPQKVKNKTVLNTILFHKRRFLEVLLDLGLICVAYYSAYFLRFEGSLLSANIHLMADSLAWIVFVKMAVFFTFGLYRGVWRYVSISDLFTIFKVVTLGSVASILTLTFLFRFRDYSRAVFFIDWLLLLFLISGARISFRILGEFFSRLREKGKNILIFGAGDTGEMVLREIKRNKILNYNPIGFIDDDPGKIGNRIHGIPVLGSRQIIKDLIHEQSISELIIAIPSVRLEDIIEVVALCKERGINYRVIKGILDRIEIT